MGLARDASLESGAKALGRQEGLSDDEVKRLAEEAKGKGVPKGYDDDGNPVYFRPPTTFTQMGVDVAAEPESAIPLKSIGGRPPKPAYFEL